MSGYLPAGCTYEHIDRSCNFDDGHEYRDYCDCEGCEDVRFFEKREEARERENDLRYRASTEEDLF